MNSNRINIELHVDDKGSVTVKNFGDQTTKSLDKSRESVSKFSDKSSSVLSKLKSSWMAVTAATAAAVAVAKKSIEAFMQQEEAELKLAVAMKNAGNYTQANFRAMKEYASAQQLITKYGDEVTLATMASLQTYGMSTEELKKATKASMDLASAKGIDLRAASELVGKAFVGETGSLSRYGIILEKGVEGSKKFEAVLGLIEQRFGGTAQAELETYGGQWKQISNWWGDILEKVGLGLLKTLEAVQLALGILAAGFYGVFEGIFAGLSKLISYAEKIPIIGEKFKGMREGLDSIAGGFEESKNAALKFADTNLTMLTGFDRVEKFAEKSFKGITKAAKKSGTEQVKIDKKTAKAFAKSAEGVTDNWQIQYRDRYDVQSRALDRMGMNEKELATAAQKAAQDKIKAANDYARESTRIYETLRKEIDSGDTATYQSKAAILQKQYTEYKKHLVSLGRENETYADGVHLLDTWLANEKTKLWDGEVQKHGSVMDRMELRWREYQREGTDANRIMYDAISAGAANLEGQLSDNLFAALTGDMKNLKMDWDSLWKSMVRSVTDAVAKMATEAAIGSAVSWMSAIFASKGIWEVKGDGIPVIAHDKEMIVPGAIAEKIRANMGGSEYGSNFEGLSKSLSALDPSVSQGFMQGTTNTYGKIGGVGLAAAMQGVISPAQFVKGMINPATIVTSAAVGGVPGAAKGAMGITGKWGDFGSFLGMMGAMALGVPGIAAAMIGQPVGAFIMDALGDTMNARGLEGLRDSLENSLGYFGGRIAFSDFVEGMGESGWGTEGMTGWGGYGGLGIGNPASYGGSNASTSGMTGYGGFGGLGIGNPGSYGGSNDGMGGLGGTSSGDSDGSGGTWRYGGITRGPESGHRETLHGIEAVVPLPDGRTIPVEMTGGADSRELLAELKKLRVDLQIGNYTIACNTLKMAKILDKFDGDGLPAERT